MNSNWTYKKLGELGQVITGSTPATKDSRNYTSQDVCFFKPSDFDANSFTVLKSSEYHISQYAYEHSRQLPKDSILTTCIGIIGKVGILDNDATCNQQINAIIPNREIIVPRFLGYSIMSIKKILTETANAPVVPLLNKSQFSSISIPVPSLVEQQAIVNELDTIHSVLDKQNAQLLELDKLAQAIFYDMFGDPIANDRGWEVKQLSEIVSVQCTLSYGIVQPGDGVEDGVPVVRPVDLIDTFVSVKGLKKTTPEISNSYKRTLLTGRELLMCVRGTIGVVGMATNELKGCNVTRGITPILFNNDATKWLVFYIMKTREMKQKLAELTRGIALKGINMSDVRKLPIVFPSLVLQQQFAERVEAIEQQKQLLRQSIRETEKLLAARMQHYFD